MVMIYIGIVGSRHRSEKKLIRSILNRFNEKMEIVLVSGGAKGIDTEAEQIAKQMNIPTLIYKPEGSYRTKGNNVYFERNQRIADKCDYLFAFPLDRKGGTMNTVHKFKDKKHLLIID